MIILRIAEGIRNHFPARASEWALAAGLSHWGRIVYNEPSIFNRPGFSQMAEWAEPRTWGLAAMTVGGIRLIALVINGTFADTRYGQISPHVRGATAFLSCFVWLQIYLGLQISGDTTTGLGIYPYLLALDCYNTARAFGDAGEADRAKKYGGS